MSITQPDSDFLPKNTNPHLGDRDTMDDLRKILKMNHLVGQTVHVRVDDIALDLDGVPSSVGDSIEYDNADVYSAVALLSELTRQGLKPSDLPGLTVIDDRTTEREIHER